MVFVNLSLCKNVYIDKLFKQNQVIIDDNYTDINLEDDAEQLIEYMSSELRQSVES